MLKVVGVKKRRAPVELFWLDYKKSKMLALMSYKKVVGINLKLATKIQETLKRIIKYMPVLY